MSFTPRQTNPMTPVNRGVLPRPVGTEHERSSPGGEWGGMGLPEGDFDSSLGDEGLALDGRIAEGEACESVESAGDAGCQGMKPGHRGGRE